MGSFHYRPRPLPGWRSRSTFMFALAAAAVGLGNLWRFSWLAGQHGGGAFILVYIACLLLLAVPVMTAEVALGMHGRGSAQLQLKRTAVEGGLWSTWQWLGPLAMVTGLLVSAYYAVVAGWSLVYIRELQSGVFSAASALAVAEHLEEFLADPNAMRYWFTAFMLTCLAVSAAGVRWGLGLLVWFSIPGIAVLLYVLVDFALEVGDLEQTRDFLFSVKWVDFTFQTFIHALTQALFTLGIGVGVGLTFGAYAPQRVPIFRTILAVGLFDLIVAVGAGLAIFPVIFAANMVAFDGPGLMFIAVPYGFGNIAQGELYGALYFGLVVLVALGSTVALMESAVAWMVERTGWGRLVSVLMVAAVVWSLGLLVIDSLAQSGGEPHLLGQLDRLTSRVLIPLVVLLIAVMVGWRLPIDTLRAELYRESSRFLPLWQIVLRFAVPLALAVVLLV